MNTSKSPRKISKAQHSINFLTECLCERNRDLMIQEDKNRALLNEIELLKKANESLLDRIDEITEKVITLTRIH